MLQPDRLALRTGVARGRRMREGLALAICALSLVSATNGRALAQASPPPATTAQPSAHDTGAAEYDAVVQKALVEFNLGHWSEAKAYFMRAHQLRPSARTLRSLGLASYELRLYVAALMYLRQALASQERPLTEEMRGQAKTQIDEARSFITYEKPMLEPPNATLRVDGQAAVFDDDGALMLDPGQHEIVVAAQGFEQQSRIVTANGGERGELSVKLLARRPAAVVASVPHAEVPQEKPDSPSFWSSLTTPRVIALGLAGGSVVALGVGVTFSVLAANANSDSKSDCSGNECNQKGFATRNTALHRADAATVSFVAAGVLLGAGAVLYFAMPALERSPTAIRVSPSVGPGFGALSLAGVF
jgi:hypothetical protein